MEVRLRSGEAAAVLTVKVDDLEQPETTYNFEVSHQHDYFVGQSAILVHNGPSFIVTPNGQVIPVPQGATGPTPTESSGFKFTGGSGGYGLDSRVTGVRIMDPNVNQGARISYMNASGQTVDPATGRTVSYSDPVAHIPCN
jgi:hypothetical protein